MKDVFDRLKAEWFGLFERIYAETRNQTSSLPCAECCPDDWCEANERVYFLPFETEYIEMRTGRDLLGSDDIWKIGMPFSADVRHSVGLKDEFRPCPFFDAKGVGGKKQCDIYEHRPLDCRSFPAMPVFSETGIDIEFEPGCPALKHTAPDVLDAFAFLHRKIWGVVAEKLPASWKIYYWNTERLVPEIMVSNPRPRHVDICGRLGILGGVIED